MSTELKNTTGVIIAAGMGTRLGSLTKNKPKALIEVNGRTLINYALSYLRELGIKKRIVIGGFCFNDLSKKVKELDPEAIILENKEYKKGNLYTFDVALKKIENSFFLMNVDHIYSKDIVKMVKKQISKNIIAFIDTDRILTDDDMKVSLKNKMFVKDMSKKLKVYDCGYVGQTYCDVTKLSKYKKAVQVAKNKYKEKAVVEDVLRILGSQGKFIFVGDISGSKWYEIDTPLDLENSQEIILNNNLYT